MSTRGGPLQVAVDTGGTFTDVLLVHEGRWIGCKLASTPSDPGEAVLNGIAGAMTRAGLDGTGVGVVIHGTTVGTNALLERAGARVIFVTTRGFEDLLVMARQTRSALYDLRVTPRHPLVADGDVVGVEERLEPTGAAFIPLEPAGLDAVLEALSAYDAAPTGEPVRAVAICLLHAYANPVHEAALQQAIAERFPHWRVCRSSEVLAEIREYERASTTLANAYLAPLVGDYLGRLLARLTARRTGDQPAPRLRIMQSSGGLMSASEAARYPVHTALSGPAGGVLGALAAARAAGVERIVSFDMGGTSTDVGFCEGGLTLTGQGQVAGLPIHVPMVDIHTVGAGGGSIAYLDPGGALRVGPRSAGAQPGPACYGRGGVAPTVTDANLVLGRLHPAHFLGGEMALDAHAAREAVDRFVARPLGIRLEDAAEGIVAVANAAMARAIRVISVERGHAPDDLALVAFGGAGGMHACELAADLGIPTVVVPPHPGLLSAFGMLHADVVRHASRSLMLGLPRRVDGVEPSVVASVTSALAALSERALSLLAQDGVGSEEAVLFGEADLRYVGQGFEIGLAVGLPPRDASAEHFVQRSLPDWVAGFEDAHERQFGYRMPERGVQLVTLRLRAVSQARPQPLQAWAGGAGAERAWLGQAPIVHEGVSWPGDHYARARLGVGDSLVGPAVINEYSATTWVPPNWTLEVAHSGALRLRRG